MGHVRRWRRNERDAPSFIDICDLTARRATVGNRGDWNAAAVERRRAMSVVLSMVMVVMVSEVVVERTWSEVWSHI